MRKIRLTKILSWCYILVFFAILALVVYLYRSLRFIEGANTKCKFQVNDEVKIWWEDEKYNGEYYDGKITKKNKDCTYNVKYNENDATDDNVDESWIERKEDPSATSPPKPTPPKPTPTVKYLNNTTNEEKIKKEYPKLDTCGNLSVQNYKLNGNCVRSNWSQCYSDPFDIKTCPDKNINNCNGVFVCGNCASQGSPCPSNSYGYQVISMK
jgi:hypothetical protein